MPWYVIYTKPNSEKKVADSLEKKGVTVYCPVHETLKQWSDRKKKVSVPLFKSYVFVFLADYDQEKIGILLTQGVVKFLFWLGNPAIVREEEIEAIRGFLNGYKGLDIVVEYNVGDSIEIKEGPLVGQQGELISIKGTKVVLLLKSLRLNLTAEVSANSIKARKD